TFGHVAQMPQIVRGFGMDSFVFWRGLGDDSDRLGVAFRWRGPDGSTVLAIRQIDGYHALRQLGQWTRGPVAEGAEPGVEVALRRLRELAESAWPYLDRTGVVDLLAGNGTDHAGVQRDLPSLLRECRAAWPEARFEIAGLDDYVEALRSSEPHLAEYRGEMCEGKDAHILRGVNSARMPLKQRNEAVERSLLEAEVACSLCYLEGGSYPLEDLRLAWRHLLRNHPHDSICGCSVDQVHREMGWRFDAAEQLAERLKREALWRRAGGSADWSLEELPGAEASAVNLLPWRRRGLVELPLPGELARARRVRAEGSGGELPAQVVSGAGGAVALVSVEVAAFGASRLRLEKGTGRGATGARLVGERALENEYYRVEVLDDGTLDVLHKPTGRRLAGAHWFEDEADRGDEYNFCPVEGGSTWDSRRDPVKVRGGLGGPAVASLTMEIGARLPSGLRADRRGRLSARVACPIGVEVRLVAGVDRVEFSTTVVNRARDHRLRVVFPAAPAEQARVEGHYAVLRRPVGVQPHGPGWMEPRSATHHTLGFVEVAGTVVLGRGLPEYEARPASHGTEIALTLLRCVGWLSRNDLSTRPGWAGPGVQTPEAQCPGTHRFQYALSLADEPSDAELTRRSHDYRFGVLVGPAGLRREAALSVDGEGFCFAGLKGAEDGDGVILRLYNPGEDAATVAVDGRFAVEPCRLDEEPSGEEFDGRLSGGRIVSLRLRRR
ncbi:MAG: glycoside hydrolase family 38 C-terminal domain-containing protein, partial [Sphingomonadaceae bacterium]